MKSNLLPAIRLTLICLLLCAGIYTLLVLGIAQIVPGKGNGNTFSYKGKNYFSNIGQSFTEDQYFSSRPSAVAYNAARSGGSNKGPSNIEYLALVQARIDTFLKHNPGMRKAEIPVDLITASGSGLDPNISVAAAKVQIKRIARLRKKDEGLLVRLIDQHTERPLFGLFGPAKINVLELNVSLDNLR